MGESQPEGKLKFQISNFKIQGKFIAGTPAGCWFREKQWLHARADALAAADEGVRRGARGGRVPQFLRAGGMALTGDGQPRAKAVSALRSATALQKGQTPPFVFGFRERTPGAPAAAGLTSGGSARVREKPGRQGVSRFICDCGQLIYDPPGPGKGH
jgi:hypothetical protein